MIETLLDVLHRADGARDRSRQIRLGPSAVGSCRRQSWLRLQGVAPVNDGVLRASAIMGTAIHAAIEQAFRREDPWGDRYEIEVEVDELGVMGHVDLYDKREQAAWDWKTITMKKAKAFPTMDQILQVMIYGRLLIESGRPVEKVGLIGIPRDGSEESWIEWSAPFDERLADEGLARLAAIEQATEAPEPDQSPRFCASYCPFYGAGVCLGAGVALDLEVAS